ncbi:hypothetical protein MCOR07_009340 [Pyricularia oryzae]|uniref:Uncharacterized protein n=1 Tax=Pyricularia grisea TaxID=148305 RepID=A0ABQ8NJ35_PYRGI|nr:hypothetical protein MCOR01_007704 [Pyricularia oryzae]KAI6297764.1 hypothetical protein MCOR33_006013 [Pyricularia grisea]KAI6344791.1 hypothetical protein MCOR30_001049 [Pyricularia oryzae]KAI6384284.1 hypothetical protein MCOR32_002210 [Pyricularia oryzae]KAI6613152.1 hypothetical protein MCOR07_009340 [Pyricularia oryzae]
MSMLERVQAELWSVEDERKLIQECPNFDASQDQDDDELEAWRLLGYLYDDAMLSDLFTYGLRIGKVVSANGQFSFYHALCHVLVYPGFKGNLNTLRFVLQMIAYIKIENHARPFGPVSPHPKVMETFYNLRAKYRGKVADDGSRRDEGAVALALWKDTNPANDGHICKILDNLQLEIDRWLNRQPATPVYSPAEQQAFVVDTDDLALLVAAIEKTSPTRCNLLLDEARIALPDGTRPLSFGHLETIKNRLAVEHERRYRLRKRLLASRGEAAGRDLHVFDKPGGDPDPVYVYADDVKPGELRVLAGEVMPLRYPVCLAYSSSTHHVDAAAGVGASRSMAGTRVTHVRMRSRAQSPDFGARDGSSVESPVEVEDDGDGTWQMWFEYGRTCNDGPRRIKMS